MNVTTDLEENIKCYYGIDTLYYFCESNRYYDDLYLDILDQMENTKGFFEKREIEYKPSDIRVTINEMTLDHLGKAEGFYWFKDMNDFFKIGFKDTLKNQGVHDIRVQLLSVGIYTVGIKTLLKLIDELLADYITKNKPVTRIDLNCFVQEDFSFINKEMFVSRKRNYNQISEFGTSKRTQTLYVGKAPFQLRLYDKKEEMKQSPKRDLMQEFFLNQGFDLDKELFNIEFEMHRRHLKSYGIETVEDAIANAKLLFQNAMDEIRLIDLGTITQKDIQNNSKSRAKTLPIWEKIKEDYTIESFMQNITPLERIKRKEYFYAIERFKNEFEQLIRKGFIHRIPITRLLIEEYLENAITSLTVPRPQTADTKKGFLDVEIEDKEGIKEHFRLLDNGLLIKPVNAISVASMSDYDLLCYLEDVSTKAGLNYKDSRRWEIAHEEAAKRGLVEKIPF